MDLVEGLASQPELGWGRWLIVVGCLWLASRPNPPGLIVLTTVLGVVLSPAPPGGLDELVASGGRGYRLPGLSCGFQVERAPVLLISTDAIALNGAELGDPRTVKDDPGDQLPVLAEALAALAAEERASFEASGAQPFWRGRLILLADRSTPSEVINKVVAAVYRTGWEDISFAVDERAIEPERASTN